jgi:hypothetical protein
MVLRVEFRGDILICAPLHTLFGVGSGAVIGVLLRLISGLS